MDHIDFIPSNWSSSSNYITTGYPLVNLMSFNFSGLSAPRKTMRCPVGRYVIEPGERSGNATERRNVFQKPLQGQDDMRETLKPPNLMSSRGLGAATM